MSDWPQSDKPSRKITLTLDQPSTLGPNDDLRDGLSAITRQGEHLWVANDETTSVERLTLEDDLACSHRSFDLTRFLQLPGEGEIDIEGLDVEGETLWLLGSHSAVRKRVRDKHEPDQARKALATVEKSDRRQVLARLSIRALLDPGGSQNSEQNYAQLLGHREGSGIGLLNLLADDPHLGGFITHHPIPGKDNGIDCEGLAVSDDRVFLGLRGPVLRGWAVIIELRAGGASGYEGHHYGKHFLDLRGLGIRDLCRHGKDLLVLAGPTMELDGRTALFRWRNALTSEVEAVVPKDELKCELNVPFGKGEDRAEGITLLEDGKSILVVYDTPAIKRKSGRHDIQADVFNLRE